MRRVVVNNARIKQAPLPTLSAEERLHIGGVLNSFLTIPGAHGVVGRLAASTAVVVALW